MKNFWKPGEACRITFRPILAAGSASPTKNTRNKQPRPESPWIRDPAPPGRPLPSWTPITLADRGVIIAGNPESCRKIVQMYEDIGVDQCLCIMQTETIPHDKVMESIELFGKEVIPAFRDQPAKAGAAG